MYQEKKHRLIQEIKKKRQKIPSKKEKKIKIYLCFERERNKKLI